jgi:hypothetical protein
MSTKVAVALAGALGVSLLSGCEVLIPLLIAQEASDDYDDEYTDPYYGDPYYSDPYYDETLYGQPFEIEVESLRGQIGGLTLGDDMTSVTTQGTQNYTSANFALMVGADPEEMPEAERMDPYTTYPGADLQVWLDVCPIDDVVGGGPVSNPEGGFLNLSVCTETSCLDGYSGNLQIEVEELEGGVRRVTATSDWGGDDNMELTLRYVPPSGD